MTTPVYPDPRQDPNDPLPSDLQEDYESPFRDRSVSRSYRGAASDPIFGYLIAVALSVGLIPLIRDNADLRYVLLWLVLAGFGVLSWLLGKSARIGQETPENLVWGVIFGLIIAVPFLIVGSDLLRETDQRLFAGMSVGEVLAFLIFVMPLSETLFFRGVLQESYSFGIVGLLSSLWSALVFFPVLDVGRFPAVALVVGTALVVMNLMYSYVRRRNGLAAAWLCQIVVNLTLLFLPYV